MKPNTADYKEIKGTIIKKKQTIFGRRYLYISDGDRTVSVVIGKSAFDFYTVGMKMTVGYVGHQLINCRPGTGGDEESTDDKGKETTMPDFEMYDENLYVIYLSLAAGLIGDSEYRENLHALFLEDKGQDPLLLELEWSSEDREKTLGTLSAYFSDKIERMNYDEVGKLLFKEVERQFGGNLEKAEEISGKLYQIWTMLPERIAGEEPFIQLNSINDYWSWGGEDEGIEAIDQLIKYYR